MLIERFVVDIVVSALPLLPAMTLVRYRRRGSAAYHPSMLVAMLLTAMYQRVRTYSSRRIEQASYESLSDVFKGYISANTHTPITVFDAVAKQAFRKRIVRSTAEALFVKGCSAQALERGEHRRPGEARRAIVGVQNHLDGASTPST